MRVFVLPEKKWYRGEYLNGSLVFKGIRSKILEILKDGPKTLGELSKELKLLEQNVFYHLKHLVKVGAVKRVAEEGKPIRYALSGELLMLKFGEGVKAELVQEAVEFPPFITNATLNFTVIIGAPDPHGPEKARARDNSLVGYVLVAFAPFVAWRFPLVLYDTQVLSGSYEGPFIVLGGPVTNLFFAKINKFLPAKFKDRNILTPKTVYTDDFAGFIAVSDSPYGTVLAVAGRTLEGTKAAVLALRTFIREAAANGIEYMVVEGYDRDADGHVDSFEVVETG